MQTKAVITLPCFGIVLWYQKHGNNNSRRERGPEQCPGRVPSGLVWSCSWCKAWSPLPGFPTPGVWRPHRASLVHKPSTAAFISLIMRKAETHLFPCFAVDSSPKNVHSTVFMQVDRDMLGPKHRTVIRHFGFKFMQEIQFLHFPSCLEQNSLQILTIFLVRFQTISWRVTAVCWSSFLLFIRVNFEIVI